MSIFYSDLLTDAFFEKINKLKIEKGFLNDTPKRKILNYTFIFINTDNCDCIYINQNELSLVFLSNPSISYVNGLLDKYITTLKQEPNISKALELFKNYKGSVYNFEMGTG